MDEGRCIIFGYFHLNISIVNKNKFRLVQLVSVF